MNNLKKISLSRKGPKDLLDIQVERPWGYFKKFCENSPVTVKLIVVKPKEILSLQSHAKRAEFWCIIDGSGRAEIGTEIYKLKKQMELVVPKKTKHRLAAGINGLKVLEISFGDFSEDDIVRYQDKYGRI